jgi:DNA modification methylase
LLSAGEAAGFTLLNIVVWAKTNAGMGSLYRSQHEFVVVFKKGIGQHVNNIELGIHGRYRTNLWTYPGASSLGSEARAGMHDHPTPKPVALLEDAILDVTNRGDLVFDSFSGSGSTLIATNKSGRFFCGTELDPGYVDLILHRWIKLTGLVPILVASGETFDDVKARREKEAESKTAQPTNSPILSDPQKRETKEDEVTP